MVPSPRSITFPGRFNEVRRACALVRATAVAAGFDEQEQFHIELACDEACTNIIEHAYGGEDRGDIRLDVSVNGDELRVELRDSGRPFAPQDVPAPSALLPGVTVEPGGVGLYLIHQLMDEVTFEFSQEGNMLAMTKRLPIQGERRD